MNKKDLTEADIRTKLITPAIVASGWDLMTQLREEAYFTKGRVMVRGKTVARGEANKADYLVRAPIVMRMACTAARVLAGNT